MLVTSALTIIFMRNLMPDVELNNKRLSLGLLDPSDLDNLVLSTEHISDLQTLFAKCKLSKKAQMKKTNLVKGN
jgi:hypothetical protein